MIAHLVGEVVERFGSSLIIDVNGVGYEMMVPMTDFESCNLGEER